MKQLKLLIISFHFPPISNSSGYLRSLKFAKYLPSLNIEPTVLTVKPNVYDTADFKNLPLLDELSEDTRIHRTTAFNASKHFSWKGKYVSWLAIPDLWSSWLPFGVFKGIRLERKNNFDAIWVTYPISTALFIGYFLSIIINKSLYIDLRDPVWEEETWEGTIKQKLLRWIEKKVIFKAKAVIFTSLGTIKKYEHRYDKPVHKKFHLIENGFDEDDFSNLPVTAKPTKKLFLHSGLIPIYERNPTCFFLAVAELKEESKIHADKVIFRLRATGFSQEYKKVVKDLDIADLVEIAERTSYKEALSEMLIADYLITFQHRTCNWQTPAKIYEYFRAGKPLLLLIGTNSDTHALVKQSSVQYQQAEIDNINEIKGAIMSCLTNMTPSSATMNYQQYSRSSGAEKLAKILRQK